MALQIALFGQAHAHEEGNGVVRADLSEQTAVSHQDAELHCSNGAVCTIMALDRANAQIGYSEASRLAWIVPADCCKSSVTQTLEPPPPRRCSSGQIL